MYSYNSSYHLKYAICHDLHSSQARVGLIQDLGSWLNCQITLLVEAPHVHVGSEEVAAAVRAHVRLHPLETAHSCIEFLWIELIAWHESNGFCHTQPMAYHLSTWLSAIMYIYSQRNSSFIFCNVAKIKMRIIGHVMPMICRLCLCNKMNLRGQH